MKCREIMTSDPLCCLPDDTVEKAAILMKNNSIGAVPIIESVTSKQLLGIITDRDITVNVVADGLNPREVKVTDIMTRASQTYDLLVCHDDDDIERATALMEQCQVRRIPVLNGLDQVIGIIAQADIATRMHNPEKSAEVVEKISQPLAKAAGK